MWLRWSVLVALSLLAARAPLLRHGGGGVAGTGLLFTLVGEQGASERWVKRVLADQLRGKYVHYVRDEHSWSGKVVDVTVLPPSADAKRARQIELTVESASGMGDKGDARVDFDDRATIPLEQVSGLRKEASRYIGARIKYRDDAAMHSSPLPDNPAAMLRAGYPNTVIAFYSDGYLEVEVTGLLISTGSGTAVASGAVFIHLEDIIHDDRLEIVFSP